MPHVSHQWTVVFVEMWKERWAKYGMDPINSTRDDRESAISNCRTAFVKWDDCQDYIE